MRAMAVDAVTAEVTAALAESGVESVLLKGPSIAAWLYDAAGERPYVDSDLLVAPDRAAAAHRVLERLGFTRAFGPLPHTGMEDAPSYPWQRGEAMVDLHVSLPGASAKRARVWEALRAGCVEQVVGGRPTLVLGEPARLVHVALHAAHHGLEVERPAADLRRALARAPEGTWAAAASIATDIGADVPFARALATLPEGRARLADLGLEPPPAPVEPVPLADGVERLASAPGWAAKAGMLRDELLPSPAFMRWWTPLASRSRRGLAAAYVWRWIYLARHAPRAVAASRRNHRNSA